MAVRKTDAERVAEYAEAELGLTLDPWQVEFLRVVFDLEDEVVIR